METKRAVAFIPEFKFHRIISRRVSLSPNIYLLPENNILAVKLRAEIESKGYKISGGSCLYFEGSLNEDGTLYEIFQGYALALTFLRPKGRVTCRALKDLDSDIGVELFIDEYDKFGYETEDVVTLGVARIKEVRAIYARVESQLENKSFNPLRNSLEFFILFLSEKQIRTRLLYLSICLESILLEGDSEGLSYKLGIRCANLLYAFYRNVDTELIFEEIRNGYTLRSKIIHGDDYNEASARIIRKKGGKATELSHILTLETVVKDILSVVFSNGELYNLSIGGKLGKATDQKYILDR